MAQLTYEQQIEKLEKEKNMIIPDRLYAESTLKRIGYFALISGYKDLLKNPTTKKYRDGVTFDDIVALYKFDENLREVFLKYILKVERHFRSQISYFFTQKHGETQSAYLEETNFNMHESLDRDRAELLQKLNDLANVQNGYAFINHHRENYQNVPLWVLVNGLTFGSLSVFYGLMTKDLQVKVAKDFPFVKEEQISKILKVLTKFRNVCAHGERLFTYQVKETIPDLLFHEMLKIPKKKGQYAYGKRDLFAAVLVLRCLLDDADFAKFKQSIEEVLAHYLQSSTAIGLEVVLSKMGFPKNWTLL